MRSAGYGLAYHQLANFLARQLVCLVQLVITRVVCFIARHPEALEQTVKDLRVLEGEEVIIALVPRATGQSGVE